MYYTDRGCACVTIWRSGAGRQSLRILSSKSWRRLVSQGEKSENPTCVHKAFPCLEILGFAIVGDNLCRRLSKRLLLYWPAAIAGAAFGAALEAGTGFMVLRLLILLFVGRFA